MKQTRRPWIVVVMVTALLLGEFSTVVKGFPPRHETVGCVRHSSSLNKCIQNAIQHYVTYMSNGKISDRIYVMSIDPLAFPNATLVRNRNIHTYFQSREMRGFKNSFVTDVKADLNKLEFLLQFHMPALDVHGSYRAELASDKQIAEWAKMFSSIRNSTLRIHLKGMTYENDDRIYVRVNITDFDISIGDHTVGFGWFTMSGNYTEHSQMFDLERGRNILSIVESEFTESFRANFQQLLNDILRLAPFERFFPSQ
ncbi:AAEL001305-PA [Aedes aegypti]|uniref:AAEL001305-PA n=1 Tax=Aedes aegypti TaxID=7159 RepID=Q17LL5_AEDAE|nr:AAEL001305-PA [Aedes aegypti]